jgi:hypothetical protein
MPSAQTYHTFLFALSYHTHISLHRSWRDQIQPPPSLLPLLFFPSLETGRQRKRKRALKRARPRRLRAKPPDRRLPVKTRDRQRLVKTRDRRRLAKTRDRRRLAKTRDPRRDHDHAYVLLPQLVTREAGDDAVNARAALSSIGNLTLRGQSGKSGAVERACMRIRRKGSYAPRWTGLYTRPCMQRTTCGVITH